MKNFKMLVATVIFSLMVCMTVTVNVNAAEPENKENLVDIVDDTNTENEIITTIPDNELESTVVENNETMEDEIVEDLPENEEEIVDDSAEDNTSENEEETEIEDETAEEEIVTEDTDEKEEPVSEEGNNDVEDTSDGGDVSGNLPEGSGDNTILEEDIKEENIENTITDGNGTDVETNNENTIPDTDNVIEGEDTETSIESEKDVVIENPEGNIADSNTIIVENAANVETTQADVLSENVTTEIAESTMVGNSNTPYFEMDNGDTAYCVEADKSHPTDGTDYESETSDKTQSNYDFLKDVFINKYTLEKEGVDTDLLNKVMQQVIWAKIDNFDYYRFNTQVWLGDEAVELFDRLMAETDTSGYNVFFTEYVTNSLDLLGNRFQTLLSAYVEGIPQQPVQPEEPADPPVVPSEPEQPEIPDLPIQPEKPVQPETSHVPEVHEPTPEVSEHVKRVPTAVRPTAEKGFLSMEVVSSPQTGDAAPIAFFALIGLASLFVMSVIVKKMNVQ